MVIFVEHGEKAADLFKSSSCAILLIYKDRLTNKYMLLKYIYINTLYV